MVNLFCVIAYLFVFRGRMPYFLKINQFFSASFLYFRLAADSDFTSKSGSLRPESLAVMLRIGWPTWFGIPGRFAPDYAILRNPEAAPKRAVFESKIRYAWEIIPREKGRPVYGRRGS